MATYLIAGIAGFIGSTLARAVLAQGDQVRGIDNLSTGKTENIAEILNRIDFREADLLDMKAVQSACTGTDYVLHQAAIPSVPKSVLDPLGSNRANVDATDGDGTQSRDFTYVDNAVEANLLACRAPASQVAGGVFNIANWTPR